MPELEQPPKVPRLEMIRPVIEPAIRDIPEFDGTDFEVEVVDVERGEEMVSEELRDRAIELALGHDRLREAIAGKAHVVLGVSSLDGKRTKERALTVVVHVYEDAATYEVLVVGEGDALEIRDVTQSEFQPGPSDDEIQRAIEIARTDDRVARQLADDFFAEALLVSVVEPGDEHYGRRRFSVVFGPPEERLPRVNAVVDLLDGSVVSAHFGEGGSR